MVKTKKTTRTGGKGRGKYKQGPPDGLPKVFVRSLASGQPSPSTDLPDASFSLRDAAKNTDRHRTQWGNPDLNLRSQAIDFVRGSDKLKGTLENDTKSLALSSTPQADFSRHVQPTSQPMSSDGVQSAQTWTRELSPIASDSSDEVVVFTGRRRLPRSIASETQISTTAGLAATAPKQSATDSVPAHDSSREAPGNLGTGSSDEPAPPSWQSSIAEIREQQVSTNKKLGNPKGKHGKDKTGRHSTTPQSDNSDSDAILADYMDNMRAYGEIDDDFVSQAQALNGDADSWSPSELVDFNDLSTSTELSGALGAVLSKRLRSSGLQYLVTWQGQSVDEARWIHHESLSMDGASELIRAFEKQQEIFKGPASTAQGREDDSSAEDDIDSDESLSELVEDFEDERDLIERQIHRMTDEQIARLLTKQEELGMGSDELLLFDDLNDTPGSDSGINDDGFVAFGPSGRQRRAQYTRKKSHNNPFDPFLGSAHELLGDDYGDFDVMDFTRSSLGHPKPSKDTDISFGLSDSDLEAELRSQFATDRNKKKAKKKEREELRAQGLLGKRNKFKPDTAARYNEGLSISQFQNELEDFLFSEHISLSLPPMGKRERKIIHEVASQFNLKSKSVGSGKSRFPVLYKTSRTTDFDATTFKRVERKLQRNFLPRMDISGKGKSRLPARRSGGGGITSGTGYAEGETVGATAPELGSENRGRAMLEKMGWSTGMALGALDNKGILQPIAHIVKKSRAGLG